MMAQGFGLYIHWPYCLAKCPYCDFNSHVSHRPVDQAVMAKALMRDIDFLAGRRPHKRVTSIFFGGGTPSLMTPATVGTLLDHAAKRWSLSPEIEISLEANPTSIEAENFRGYRHAGVNRVSVGVQALNDRDLKRLGRQHSAAEALKAFHLAQETFASCSFDLIYARPGQTEAQWENELGQALAQGASHMSLYQLTIEPGTAYADLHAKGLLKPPKDALAIRLFDLTDQLTRASGLRRYEVSNHARPGDECRHNQLYWAYGEYAGAGPGAHSRLEGAGGQRLAYRGVSDPNEWLERGKTQGHGLILEETLPLPQQAEEYLMMGLRRTRGIDLDRFAGLKGAALDKRLIGSLHQAGLVHHPVKARLAVTDKGVHVLNRIIAELL